MSLRLGRRCLGGIGVIALGGTELLVAREGGSRWHHLSDPGPSTLPDLVALAAAAVALTLGLCLAVGLTVALLERAPGRPGDLARPLARHCAPAVTRRWAALLLGATLGAGVGLSTGGSPALGGPPGPPALAAPRPAANPDPGFRPSGSIESLATESVAGPGWTPSAPPQRRLAAVHLVSGPAASRPGGLSSPSSTAGGREVVVTRGDSLWTIVRHALGPAASDAEVAHAWPRWYATNRTVIGPDPDLIQPGQVLRAPSRQGSGSPSPATASPTGVAPR